MRVIDEKVGKNLSKYIFQCLIATIILLIALLFLDVITETAIIASLGATSFIIFTMPKSYSSSPKRLIGGYTIGISMGIICNYFGSIIYTNNSIFSLIKTNEVSIFFAAIAVGLSIFLMTITNTEHAPAAGIALGLVINQWNSSSVLFIIIVMLSMAATQHILKSYLINLTSP